MCKFVKATDLPASKVMEFRQAFLSAGECSIPGSRGLHNYDKYEEWLWMVKECEKPDNTLLGVQASTYFAVRNDDTVVGCIELRHTLNDAWFLQNSGSLRWGSGAGRTLRVGRRNIF